VQRRKYEGFFLGVNIEINEDRYSCYRDDLDKVKERLGFGMLESVRYNWFLKER